MKLFRNCPEENNRKECDGCPLLKHCVKRKIKRKFVRFFNTHKQLFVLVPIVIIVLICTSVATNVTLNLSRSEAANKKVDVVGNTIKASLPLSNMKTDKSPKIVKVTFEKIKPKKVKVQTVEKTKNSSLEISNVDKKNMEKIVYAEARGEEFEGQVAVAAVILNRYKFCNKKQSITQLVTKPHQFASISNITQKMLDNYPECKKAVEEALNGNDPTRQKFSEGARYFYQPDLVEGHQKEIRQGIEVLKIGNHCFHNDFND